MIISKRSREQQTRKDLIKKNDNFLKFENMFRQYLSSSVEWFAGHRELNNK